MEHLPIGDVREAPTIERSFLTAETSLNFVFEPPMVSLGTSSITVLKGIEGNLFNVYLVIKLWYFLVVPYVL